MPEEVKGLLRLLQNYSVAILTFEVNFKAQQAQVIYQLQQFYIMLAEKNPPPCCIYSTFYTGICFFLFLFFLQLQLYFFMPAWMQALQALQTPELRPHLYQAIQKMEPGAMCFVNGLEMGGVTIDGVFVACIAYIGAGTELQWKLYFSWHVIGRRFHLRGTECIP